LSYCLGLLPHHTGLCAVSLHYFIIALCTTSLPYHVTSLLRLVALSVISLPCVVASCLIMLPSFTVSLTHFATLLPRSTYPPICCFVALLLCALLPCRLVLVGTSLLPPIFQGGAWNL